MMVSKKMLAGLSVACLLSAQAVVPALACAAPLRMPTSMSAMFGSHAVKMSVHNATSEPLQLTVGGTALTIAPGKTVDVSGMDGTAITVTAATKDHAAGDVIGHITKDLVGATISVS